MRLLNRTRKPLLLSASFLVLVSAIALAIQVSASALPFRHAVPRASSASQATDNLPSPSTIPLGTSTWWPASTPAGSCPTDQVPNSVALTSWRGVVACGPINSNVNVPFPPNGVVGEGEWQCPELVMRYMYLAYGTPAYKADGNSVVDNYATNNTNPVLQAVTNDGKSHTAPVPGDILSYGPISPGHTSLVIASTVNASGVGTLTTMEQNFASTSADPTEGIATLDVGVFKPWLVTDKRYPTSKGSGVKNWLHHVLDVSPQSGLPSTLTTFSGSGFAPNETVTLSFDNTVAGIATADKRGNFSATVIVPSAATPGRHILGAAGKKGYAPNTVFYVLTQPTPTPTATATDTPLPTPTATPTSLPTPTPTPMLGGPVTTTYHYITTTDPSTGCNSSTGWQNIANLYGPPDGNTAVCDTNGGASLSAAIAPFTEIPSGSAWSAMTVDIRFYATGAFDLLYVNVTACNWTTGLRFTPASDTTLLDYTATVSASQCPGLTIQSLQNGLTLGWSSDLSEIPNSYTIDSIGVQITYNPPVTPTP